ARRDRRRRAPHPPRGLGPAAGAVARLGRVGAGGPPPPSNRRQPAPPAAPSPESSARGAGWHDGWMRRLLVLGSTVVFLDVVFYTAITPLLPGYVHDLGLSKTAAGVLTAAYAAGTLLGSLPSGFVAARIGPRRALLAGLALLGLASITFGFANHVVLLDAARFVQGVAGALAWAGALTWLILAAP